jgi:hypothetical protein
VGWWIYNLGWRKTSEKNQKNLAIKPVCKCILLGDWTSAQAHSGAWCLGRYRFLRHLKDTSGRHRTASAHTFEEGGQRFCSPLLFEGAPKPPLAVPFCYIGMIDIRFILPIRLGLQGQIASARGRVQRAPPHGNWIGQKASQTEEKKFSVARASANVVI